MVAPKPPDPTPVPPEERPRPGALPAHGDGVREVGKRAHDDSKSPRKDTDQAGFDSQRQRAPQDAPTRRSDKSGGTDDR